MYWKVNHNDQMADSVGSTSGIDCPTDSGMVWDVYRPIFWDTVQTHRWNDFCAGNHRLCY